MPQLPYEAREDGWARRGVVENGVLVDRIRTVWNEAGGPGRAYRQDHPIPFQPLIRHGLRVRFPRHSPYRPPATTGYCVDCRRRGALTATKAGKPRCSQCHRAQH